MRLVIATLSLAFFISFAPSAFAVNVYLADGGVIEAKKAWHSKGMVYVLVNRDTFLEFSPREINLKKTFPTKPRKNCVRRR